MEARHIEELRQKFRFIVNNIGEPEAVCDELLSLGVFDESYLDKILIKKPAPKAQTKELLYLLKFRGAKAYGKFITALEKSGNSHVAQELMKPEPEPVQQELIHPEMATIQQESMRPETTRPETSSVQPESSQFNSPPIQATVTRPTQVPPSPNQTTLEDAFKSWPQMCGKKTKCTEEKKVALLSDPRVYRITECPTKGFVVRVKCCPQKKNEQQSACSENCQTSELYHRMSAEFDKCNQILGNLMSFLDSPIKPGPWASKLVNQNADELEKKTGEMLQRCFAELRDAGYFMMFCLSYGPVGAGCGQVFDKNNRCVNLPNIIDEVKHCEGLRNKPKIFIVITICDEHLSVPEPSEGRTVADAGEDQSSINEDNLFVFHVYHDRQGAWINLGRTCPTTREMWFMKAFCDVFYSYSCELHLLELIEKVNELLGNAVIDSTAKTRGRVGEIKVVQKDIRKKLYFFPGIKYQGSQQASS